ncbi:SrfA family protein [Halomonas pacifica]|uniref:SrfA family protein n=1 Tax=Bisbaumannia pacifica TaxID=77098 RepID=UPI002359E7E3|nr:SrfA family protein [Halomonas pacifica]MDC8803461.1 SrfA family protein [Halomonas pacifica]
MSATLLHSGKIEHFRALGETGQPVYHSALQLRKVISRRLPGRERHLAIPQRDQQGKGVDWYSGISGEAIPWGSATEGEREDARIQLEAFRQEVIALHRAPPEGQGGDHEVFTRLVQWVCHFPDEAFIYLVDGTPVIAFWGKGCMAPRVHGMFAADERPHLMQGVNELIADDGPPLGDSLLRAAQLVDGQERDAVILAFIDGVDGCGRDQCAIAREIARQQPRLRINVMDISNSGQSDCIAEATGGRVFGSQDADAVSDMLKDAGREALNASYCPG